MKLVELLKINRNDLYGKLIAFPTDTVYGVGALIDDQQAIEKIYVMKKRSQDKPLPVLVGSVSQATSLLNTQVEEIRYLMKNYWPGALTIIGIKTSLVPKCLNPNFSTIGIRMPNCQTALDILQSFGPMAVTSINNSGDEALNNYQQITKLFGKQIDYIIEDKVISSNVSSTIIDCTNDKIKILRQGDLKIKKLV